MALQHEIDRGWRGGKRLIPSGGWGKSTLAPLEKYHLGFTDHIRFTMKINGITHITKICAALLIHEAVHVEQYAAYGAANVVASSFLAQIGYQSGYNYSDQLSKNFSDLNVEQQASVIIDRYLLSVGAHPATAAGASLAQLNAFIGNGVQAQQLGPTTKFQAMGIYYMLSSFSAPIIIG